MSDAEFSSNELAEIDALAERTRGTSRRAFIKTTGKLAFVIPCLAVFAVSRQALGQTGSGAPGMGNMGMGNMGMNM